MKLDKLQSAGYLVNHMARLFASGLQEKIVPLGIVPGQFPALLALWEKDGISQKELVSQLDIEQATLANTLTRMERDGLIKRTPHPVDARAQQIWLTAKALNIRDAAYKAAKEQNTVAMSKLSKRESELFMMLTRKIIAAMQK